VSRANHYLQKAEECRRQAERATVPGAREQWDRLAKQWDRMAEEAATESASRNPQPKI